MVKKVDLKKLPVACPACGGFYMRLDRNHAIEHGYSSLKAFRQAHDIEYATLLQRSRDKFKTLYNINYARWAVVYYTSTGEVRYVTKQYYEDYDEAKAAGIRSSSKFPLSDATFSRHFDGRNPLAIFAQGTHSRYFGFDIDTKDDALKHALKLIATLEAEGIPRDDIHVSYSGGKGYHIELFTKKHVTFQQWNTFGQYIVDRAGLTGKAIEFRPEANNSRGWKLPLTYHHKTGHFAGYVDKTTFDVMLEFDSHNYLFAIEPMPLSTVMPAIKKSEAEKEVVAKRIEAEKERKHKAEAERKQAVQIKDERLFQTKDEKIDSAVQYLKNGLVEKQTRWKVTRTLALYLYHEQGHDTDEIKEVLMEWTSRQIDAGMAETPLKDCEKEIGELLEWVPHSWGFGAKVREIEVTRHEMDWLMTVENKNARDVLWALLLKKKAYAGRDGSFFTPDRDLQKMLAKPREMSRHTLSKWKRWLADNGYIEMFVPANAYKRKKSTVFWLKIGELEQPEVIDIVDFADDIDCRKLLVQIASKLYTKDALKKLKLA